MRLGFPRHALVLILDDACVCNFEPEFRFIAKYYIQMYESVCTPPRRIPWECTPHRRILWNVMLLKNLSHATRNCLLHDFSSRPSHSECCPYVILCLLVLFVLVIPRSTNLRLSDRIGSKSYICNFELGFQELHQMPKFSWPQTFLSVTFGPFEAQVVLQTILVSTFTDNFLRRILSVKLVHNDGVHAVCQNSFLRRGRVNSALCIRFRSLMNLTTHLPGLLDICNCLCFVRIAVGGEDCMMSFFTFFFFCHQSSFCNKILISCLNHMRQQSVCTPFSVCTHHLSLFLCDESSGNSSVSKEHLFHLNVFGSHEYSWSLSLQFSSLVLNILRWRQCNQSSCMNSSPINFGIFFSILEIWLLPTSFSSCSSWCRSNHTHMMMRVSSAHLSSRNCSQILSSRRITFST